MVDSGREQAPVGSPERGDPHPKGRHWSWLVMGLVGAALLGFSIGESQGWPFLVKPLQSALAKALDRNVVIASGGDADQRAALHLLGALRIDAPHIEIGAPAWSKAPHMLSADDASLTLGYLDLWRASRGQDLRIRELRASTVDGHIERLSDGRASWQLGKPRAPGDAASAAPSVPEFEHLEVADGTLVYRDAVLDAQLDARFSLVEGRGMGPGPVAASGAAPSVVAATASRAAAGVASGVASSAASRAASGGVSRAGDPSPPLPAGLRFSGKGAYRGQPFTIELQSTGVMAVVADRPVQAVPVHLEARAGRASLKFDGTSTDPVHLGALRGRYTVTGPSLAALGDPVGVTLPTTGAFRAQGLLTKEGGLWSTSIERATIGSSQLTGAFSYDTRSPKPVLAGRLSGTKLLLADLGPAVGVPVRSATAASAGAPEPAAPKPARAGGRVLPDRAFDLPSLRAMNANVLVDIASVDLGSNLLEPLRPLRAHLVLNDGVLTLRDIDARTGQGRLAGSLVLDGRQSRALWNTDLRWDGVRLERWVRQARASADAPPYVTGTLSGRARLAGQGKSTAAILGSLRGGVRMQLVNGTVSHLAIEAAGLDVAQGLGLLIKGDDSLRIQCNVADFTAEQGVLKPRVFVLDTPDSTVFVDGTLSLATEAIDLRVVVTPKDFSPFALRAPLHVRGTFADPAVSLDKAALGTRLGAAALLAFINPLAALLPFVDVGNSDTAERGASDCKALSQRIAARPALPAPGPAPKR